MFPNDKLDEIYAVIEEMTQAIVPRLGPVERCLLVGSLASVPVLLIIVWWYRIGPGTSMAGQSLAISIAYVLNLTFCIAFLAVNLAKAGREFRHAGSKPHGAILKAFRQDMHWGNPYVAQLLTFGLDIVEYATLFYAHRWKVHDGRRALLVGDFARLGLIPSMVATTVTATALLDATSNLWLWGLVILLYGFYLTAFVAAVLRERPARVMVLLEYAILLARRSARGGGDGAG